jgi:hypothetical protein
MLISQRGKNANGPQGAADGLTSASCSLKQQLEAVFSGEKRTLSH